MLKSFPHTIGLKPCFRTSMLERGWYPIGFANVAKEAERQGVDLIQLARQCKAAGKIKVNGLEEVYNDSPAYREFSDFVRHSCGVSSLRESVLISALAHEPGECIVFTRQAESKDVQNMDCFLFEFEGKPISVFNPSKELVESISDICKFDQNGLSRLSNSGEGSDVNDIGFVFKVRFINPQII